MKSQFVTLKHPRQNWNNLYPIYFIINILTQVLNIFENNCLFLSKN